MNTSLLQTLLGAARLPFLLLTPVCVLLGSAAAVADGAQFRSIDLVLIFVGALAAHVCVNALNEYVDFRSGLDLRTIRTPFSGGSGALPANPEGQYPVFVMAICALLLTVLIGLWFVYSHGLRLLPLGVLGVIIVLSYTPWLNRLPLLCLIAPGLAFGPVMVVGTYVALTGRYADLPVFVSLPVFFVVNNLLLLNQFPDIGADQAAGRRHFPIVYGVNLSLWVYALFALSAIAVIVGGVQTGLLPPASYIALLPMLAALVALMGACAYSAKGDKLTPFLALNVVAALGLPVTLSFALLA